MALYGVGLDINAQQLNLDFKLFLAQQKGGVSLRNLKQIFTNFDKNGNGKLEAEEFQKGLNSFGFFMKKIELQAIMKYYDRNGDGVISYEEFISQIREPLNERRANLVKKVFYILDKEHSGVVTVKDLIDRFDPSQHPDYITGKKSKEVLVREFIGNFETDKHGKIHQNEFLSFYTDFSISVPSDQMFVEMIFNSWGVKEDDESDLAKEEVKFIVKTLRQKLIQMTSGTHEEFLLRKIFKEFDTNKSGFLTLDELFAMMIKLETPIHQQYLQAVFNQFDANQSGMIEFEEFVNYIVNDPYP